MSENKNSEFYSQKSKNYNKKLGLFDWQIREALQRWRNKSALEDLIGFKLE